MAYTEAGKFNTRIVLKHDTEANWVKAKNFIPLEGEIIIYDADENYSYQRIKIGDGTTKVKDLPFDNIQADWNQNDETKSDYIKNRTHGEFIGDVSIGNFDGRTFDFSAGDIVISCESDEYELYGLPYKESGFLTIVWDNEIYENIITELWETGHACVIPNKGYIFLDASVGIIIHSDDNNTHTIAMYDPDADKGVIIKQLDEKFIPDTIARTEVVNNTISNASEQITGLISDIQGLINTYILNIDYSTLAFDTTEIVIGNTTTSTTSVLGQAILGQMVLA